jgi:hypothetical protein
MWRKLTTTRCEECQQDQKVMKQVSAVFVGTTLPMLFYPHATTFVFAKSATQEQK